MDYSNPMDEIVPGLWIGDWQAARSSSSLRSITVASDAPFLGTHQFALVDGPGNDPAEFLRAVDCVAEAIRVSQPTIVHCVAGRSRSCAVVVAALVQARGMEFCAAYDLVKQKRPCAQIHPAFAPLMQMVQATAV